MCCIPSDFVTAGCVGSRHHPDLSRSAQCGGHDYVYIKCGNIEHSHGVVEEAQMAQSPRASFHVLPLAAVREGPGAYVLQLCTGSGSDL